MTWESDRAYTAGLFDGEGSVAIRRRSNGHGVLYHQLQVSLTSTDEGMVLWLQARWPGTIDYRRPRRPNHKPAWRWTLGSGAAATFLEDVLPFLQTKQAVALLGLELQETVGGGRRLEPGTRERRDALKDALTVANKRGR